MSRPRNTTPRAAAPARPAKAERAFSARKDKDASALTHERIAADIDSFRKAGGKIEVLGVTRTLQKIGPGEEAPAPSASPAAAPALSRR